MKTKVYEYYKLQQSEDGKSYNTIATITAKHGYDHALLIANELTEGQFNKYVGGFYQMSTQVFTTKILG